MRSRSTVCCHWRDGCLIKSSTSVVRRPTRCTRRRSNASAGAPALRVRSQGFGRHHAGAGPRRSVRHPCEGAARQPRLFSSLISTCRATNASLSRFSTAGRSRSCRRWRRSRSPDRRRTAHTQSRCTCHIVLPPWPARAYGSTSVR